MARWILGLTVALASGCATGPEVPAPESRLAELRPLERAILITDGVEIEVLDRDGSMPERIVPNESFRPGRVSPYVPAVSNVQTDDLKYYVRDIGYYGISSVHDMLPGEPPLVRRVVPGSPADKAGLGAGDGVYVMRLNGVKLLSSHPVWAEASPYSEGIPVGEGLSFEACQNGGSDARSCPDLRGSMQAEAQPLPYRVRVHVPSRDEPLYGRLAFFHVYSTAQGSAGRIYRLVVPRKYVDRARGGNVSVIYQPYEARYRDPLSGNTAKYDVAKVSWALWLSDVPF